MRALLRALAIVVTMLLTTGAWAMETFLPGAVIGAALCLLALTPVLWARRRDSARALRSFEARLAEVVSSGPGVRMPEPDGGDAVGAEIARLTRAVNGMLDREEDAVTRQRRFTADASHELRTPIAGLRTKIEVALADPDDTDLVGTLRDGLADVERLTQIAADLLTLARLDEGVPAPRSRLDFTALVRAELAGRSTRVRVRSRLQDGVFVDVNRPQLCRVLTNLLSNAERYAEHEIDVSLHAEAHDAVLEVSDDGPGIAFMDRERVFDRFTRLDSARSRDRGGTGLGLPVAREIIAAHGGRLHIGHSERGARLVLRLPLHGGQPERRAPEPAACHTERN